jgi:hypothetical protein
MDSITRCWSWVARLGVALLSVGLFVPFAGATTHIGDVVISATALQPEVLKISISRTVLFRNLSERAVDVAFLGYAGMHHVSERGAHIEVVFHGAGRHPYVVRFASSNAGHLHGVVEVADTPTEGPGATDLPVCTGVTVSGICYSP